MPAYDSTRFAPPAPVALVKLSSPATGMTKSDVPMLIDTGADVTLLPEAVVKELGLLEQSEQRYELIGLGKISSSSPAVVAEMIFADYIFRGQFLLVDQEWGIIGRNVLNLLTLVFDGPQRIWERR
jgi:predicted aspartyl protease